jgi:hypothetical protein
MDPWPVQPGSIDPYQSTTDMRVQMHVVLFGSDDFIAQGQPVILRELTNDTCMACWSKLEGNSSRSNCPYCDGEGYVFRERFLTMALFPGVAPVYKPGVLGSGQYPNAAYGYTDPERATGYCEWNVWLNYERYTKPDNEAPNKLYQLKVDINGNTVWEIPNKVPVRAAKWRILSVTPILGDHGRVEYFELGCEKEIVT